MKRRVGTKEKPPVHNKVKDTSSMDKRGFIWLMTGVIVTAGIALSALGITFMIQYNSDDDSNSLYVVEVDKESLTMNYKYKNNDDVTIKLTSKLLQKDDGLGSQPGISLQSCDEPQQCTGGNCDGCYQLVGDDGKISVVHVAEMKSSKLGGEGQAQCFEVSWRSDRNNPPVDCFPMTGSWYGGAQMYLQYWPINKWDKHMSFYLTGDMFSDAQQYGSVLERYWLTSEGVAIFVKPYIPLHVSTERGQLCLKGLDSDPPYKHESMTSLEYVVCMSDSPQTTHRSVLELQLIERPTDLPDLRMMKSPTWSTWARYKININQTTVMQYANEILDNQFTNSQIEIDDGYEKHYGDHTFDPETFSDAAKMSQDLHELGFRVTNWVTPFINPTSINYQNGVNNEYYIIDGDTNQAGRVVWWNGIGYSIDFTKDDACDWYFSMLDDIRQTYGIDSFKFDAGELNYVYGISNYKLHEYESNNPGLYTTKYVECVARFGKQIEVRAAYRNQNLPIFVRMFDKDSNWSYEKGLKTLIPTALTYSLIGYPYILPDMIGGNAYDGGLHDTDSLPERQLYIRWLQITAFLPAMQFSISPWQYDDDVINLSRQYVTLHETTVYDELVRASQDYVDGRADMGPIRPVWWVSRSDPPALDIDDQFMVGDRYLVAPIVSQNATSRDVYLPGPLWRNGGSQEIWWRSMLRPDEEIIKGGRMLFDYPIALDDIAWWELVLI